MSYISRVAVVLSTLILVWTGNASAQTLTADRAVELALEFNKDVIGAYAGVRDARAGWYSSLSGVLPRVTGSLTRSVFSTTNQRSGAETIDANTGLLTPTVGTDIEAYQTNPTVSGSWNLLDFSALLGVSAARNGIRAANFNQESMRQLVALQARRQFYEVVKAVWLARVADEALDHARDDARRVRALFEVGSVSKSDVLSAEVRSAQGELDSLTSVHAIAVQRITLAQLIGVPESEMGAIDTVLSTALSADIRSYDHAEVLREAAASRPDLMAAEANLKSAEGSVRSAKFRWLPYLTVSGSATFSPKSHSKTTVPDSGFVFSNSTESDRSVSGRIALNLDIFDGFAREAQIAGAQARAMRAKEARDALRRDLSGEVERVLIVYRESVERSQVTKRAVESAEENLKLIQQKYNVGSATILELIDAQVSLQRAQSELVSALADIRVAEADIDRVRGRGSN